MTRRRIRASRLRLVLAFQIVLSVGCLSADRLSADSSVVFNEVMYHPPGREEELEWLELCNQMAVDVDVSGWVLGDGVFFEFEEGTVVPAGGYMVIASSAQALEEATGYAEALGPFVGRLRNSGESLELLDNNGRRVDRVNWNDGGNWPVEPDGSGVSLAKVGEAWASAKAANWAPSARVGGTPGARNFSSPPSAAALAFSETSLSDDSASWIEIVNPTESRAELTGFVIASRNTTGAEHELSVLSLSAGGRYVIGEAALGFDLVAGDVLFAYSPGRDRVAGGVRLREGIHARPLQRPGDAHRWLVPDSPTPGTANEFSFHDEIVINEILYHPKSTPAGPAQHEYTPLLELDTEWRYDASGEGRDGSAWREAGFDDSLWESGRALLYNETSELPAPTRTLLPLGIAAYYFRAEFELDGSDDFALALRPIFDDGGIVYLNGVELLRLNMPEGEVDSDTLSRGSVANANFAGPFVVPRDALREGRNIVAVEVHQSRVSSNDVVFGLEVLAAREILPARPFADSDEAWVELYNRSDTVVDLGNWRVSAGIGYTIPEGTLLEPDEYLVVAKDRVGLELRYPDVRILGDFERVLSRRGELIRLLDDRGNPVDEVRYFDGGRWPEYADGAGSSLELRDPEADNSKAEAWAASDETDRTEWQTFSYRAVTQRDFGPTQWNELVLGLLDEGECLIDDLSVLELPAGAARELLQNGDFEPGADSWRFLGNHGRSRVIVDPDDPRNHVLHLVATGATEHMSNHGETTLADGARVATLREYEIRFRARWLGGSNQLHTRLYFNRIPRTTLLPVSETTGTPGAPNSVFESNIGPTFDDLSHSPVVPASGESVNVRVRAEDPDGVSRCTLWTSVDDGAPRSTAMTRVGGDESLWAADVGAQSNGRVVQFWIEAENAPGAVAVFPSAGRVSRALWRVRPAAAPLGRSHRVRVIMTRADSTFLRSGLNTMTNEPVGCTVVYDDDEVFYDVGVRLKGSLYGRQSDVRRGFNVRLGSDHLFRGVHQSFHIDRPVGPPKFGRTIRLDEVLFKHMANHAGGIPSMYEDVADFDGPWGEVSGTALLSTTRFTDDFLATRYEDGDEGTVWKYELIYYSTTTTTGDPEAVKRPVPGQVIGVDLEDLGDDKEAYRWTQLIKNQRDRDDYTPIIDCNMAFDERGQALEDAAEEAIDVDQWMRTFAMISLAGVVDIYTFGLEHNVLYYERPFDRRIEVFPLDADHCFYASPTAQLVGNRNLGSLMRRPVNQRRFYNHIEDIVSSTFNADYMERWIEHLGAQTRQDFTPILGYIRQRGSWALSRLPADVAFAITTNDGADFVTEETSVTVEGTANVDVRAIVVAEREQARFSFPAVTRWRTEMALSAGVNALEFIAFGRDGEILAIAAIEITRAGGPRFIRGDVDLDRQIGIGDPIQILGHLFSGGFLACEDAADLDDNEELDISDAIYALRFLFLGSDAPNAPWPEPGPDPTDNGPLDCENGLAAG